MYFISVDLSWYNVFCAIGFVLVYLMRSSSAGYRGTIDILIKVLSLFDCLHGLF